MSRPNVILVICIFFSLVGQVYAYVPWTFEWDTAWWNPDAPNSHWFPDPGADPNCWWWIRGWHEANPPDANLAIVNFNEWPDEPNGVALIIDSNNVGQYRITCWSFWLPEWLEPTRVDDPCNNPKSEAPPPVHLTMTGGDVELWKDMVIGRSDHRCTGERDWPDSGVFDMSGGLLTIWKHLEVGGRGNDFYMYCGGNGVLNLTGGTIIVHGLLVVPQGTINYVDANLPAGTVNLFGGVIDANSFEMKAHGKMYVKHGRLNVPGDQVATINGYIDANQIVPGDASYTLSVSYDADANTTTLTGMPHLPEAADLFRDYCINFMDFAVLADNWLATGPNEADIDGDETVDFEDLAMLVLYWTDCWW
jgi:hypothetical protein